MRFFAGFMFICNIVPQDIGRVLFNLYNNDIVKNHGGEIKWKRSKMKVAGL